MFGGHLIEGGRGYQWQIQTLKQGGGGGGGGGGEAVLFCYPAGFSSFSDFVRFYQNSGGGGGKGLH